MQLIDGKATAAKIKEEIAEEVNRMLAAGKRAPHLAAVLVGHDGGSETYVRNKVLACEACHFTSSLIRFEEDVTEAELLAKVDELNRDPNVDGFIVQLPLPAHISAPPRRKESSNCSVAMTLTPSEKSASCLVAATSWASLWRS